MSKTKNISLSIKYDWNNKHLIGHAEKYADLDFDVETTFSDVNEFMEDCKEIVKIYKKCAKNGTFCSVYLSCSEYEITPDPDTLVPIPESKKFNGWLFEDIPDADCEGLYLSPDLKYTPKEKDIYIEFKKPLIQQLAEAGI